jgi:hypothetical protein
MHAPSLPFAYSSGKLGDWYPDVLDAKLGKLVLYESKEGWQRGTVDLCRNERRGSASASHLTRSCASTLTF